MARISKIAALARGNQLVHEAAATPIAPVAAAPAAGFATAVPTPRSAVGLASQLSSKGVPSGWGAAATPESAPALAASAAPAAAAGGFRAQPRGAGGGFGKMTGFGAGLPGRSKATVAAFGDSDSSEDEPELASGRPKVNIWKPCQPPSRPAAADL